MSFITEIQGKTPFHTFEAFKSFEYIPRERNPEQYVCSGWNSSLTKVIDNAIVGSILYLKSRYKDEKI